MKRNIYTDALIRTLLIFVASLLVGGIITALCSCTRKVYVPTETVRTEYRDKVVESLLVDTVSLRDSVSVYVNGDTVRITKFRDRWRTRIVERHDTCTVTKTDSVQVPVQVERKLTKWEQTKMDFGGMAIGGFCAVAVLAVAVWIIKRKHGL